jgi:hypothetical protein
LALGSKLSAQTVGDRRRRLLEPRHLPEIALDDDLDLRLGERRLIEEPLDA